MVERHSLVPQTLENCCNMKVVYTSCPVACGFRAPSKGSWGYMLNIMYPLTQLLSNTHMNLEGMVLLAACRKETELPPGVPDCAKPLPLSMIQWGKCGRKESLLEKLVSYLDQKDFKHPDWPQTPSPSPDPVIYISLTALERDTSWECVILWE